MGLSSCHLLPKAEDVRKVYVDAIAIIATWLTRICIDHNQTEEKIDDMFTEEKFDGYYSFLTY